MSTQPVVYTPPTPQEIAYKLATVGGMPTLYRASVDWWRPTYRSEWFYFPPDLGGKLVKHPKTGLMVPADGKYVCRPIIETLWVEVKGQGLQSRGKGIGPGMAPQEIAAFMVQKYGPRGVVLLEGNKPGEGLTDEELMEMSRKLVYQSRRMWAERQRATRLADVDRFRANAMNAGQPLPSPTKEQSEAQRWLDRQAIVEGAKYQCPHGCTDSNEFEDYRLHMKVAHKIDVEEETTTGEEVAEGLEQRLLKLQADLEKRASELDQREAALDKGKGKGGKPAS